VQLAAKASVDTFCSPFEKERKLFELRQAQISTSILFLANRSVQFAAKASPDKYCFHIEKRGSFLNCAQRKVHF
jgi:hypothetical protein